MAITNNITSTTYSTAGDQIWYYTEPQAPQAPIHNHTYDHNNWLTGQTFSDKSLPSHNIVIYGNKGVELMRFNEDIEMKVGGKWVKVEKYLEKIDILDSMMERMYELLSPWQKKELMYSQLEKQDEEFKHFDPDLFKV